MNNNFRPGFALLAVLAMGLLVPAVRAGSAGPLVQKIKAVDKEGKGNIEAAKAWKQLIQMGPEGLPDILVGFDGASPVAANYLRSAVETIAEKTLAAGTKLPAKKLEAFILTPKHDGRARKLALELLGRVDPMAEARLLPKLLDDPGNELRRDAVARALKNARQLFEDKDAAARPAYEKLLAYARDKDQVELIAKQLKTFGVEVDLTKQFGFITEWMVAGSFDSTAGKGYHVVYPPEKKVDLSATYSGKEGKKVQWQKHVTKAPMGLVDFNQIIGNQHDVAAYAYTVVHAEKEMPVEIRAASNNAIQLFLNGKKIFGREEYHHGMHMDQHAGKGMFRAGANTLLVKVCQNNQTDDWAQKWSFQLRITDHLGTPVPVTVVLDKAPAAEEK